MDESISEQKSIEEVTEVFLTELQNGSNPSVGDYADAHPHLAVEIRELFSTLVRLENLAPSVLSQRTSDRELPRGRVIQHYRLLKLIGRGGMAEVYAAEDERIGRQVALKLIRRADSHDTVRKRFQSEAIVVGRLHHTNIVPVFDAGQDNDVDFIAMQLIDGSSLAEMVDQLQLAPKAMGWKSETTLESTTVPKQSASTDSTIDWMMRSNDSDDSDSSLKHYYQNVAIIGRQVADAIDYSHQQGVLHRDIKPGNILIDLRGQAWVTDFGLAKANEDNLTQTGDLVGTLRYMAPERLGGQCDERSDVYSIGATLFCLLGGRPPSNTGIGDDRSRSPREKIPSSVPADLAAVVLKALSTEPRERYRSAADLRDDLHRYSSGELVLAQRKRFIAQFVRWTRRNPMLFAVTALLLLTLSVAAIGSSIVAARLKQQRADLIAMGRELREERDQLLLAKDKLTTSNEILQQQLKDGHVDDVIASWTKSIETFPNLFMPYIRRGDLHLHRTHKFGQAIADFERALEILDAYEIEELNKKKAWGHYHVARSSLAELLACCDEGVCDYERSIELTQKVTQYFREWWILDALGIAYYRQGRYEDADQVLDEALLDLGDGHDMLCLYYSAMSKYQLGKHDEARKRFARAESIIEHENFRGHPFVVKARTEARQMVESEAMSNSP